MNSFIPKPKGESASILSPNDFPKTNFFLREKCYLIILNVALLFSFLPQKGMAQCTGNFVCNGSLNISVEENCLIKINPSQFFSNFQNQPTSCQDSLHVYVTNYNDELLAQGDSVTIDFSIFNPLIAIGDSIKVTVFKDEDDDNMFDVGMEPNCWGAALIEDKTAPVIAACKDTSIYCYENLANVVGGPIPSISVSDNCNNTSDISVMLVDSTLSMVDCSVNTNVKALLEKKWIVEDTFGNKDSCTQTITILRLPVTGVTINAPAEAILECNSNNPPDTSVAALGYPMYTFNNGTTNVTIELNPANTSGLCSDLKVIPMPILDLGGSCLGEEKYIRTFKIFDCCANEFIDGDTVTQSIKIFDTTAPVLTCPSSFTVGTTSNSCAANVFLPPVTIDDACTNSGFSVSMETPVGTVPMNGGIITNVPVGVHTIIYNVEDACGNMSSCQTTLTVIDNISPIAVCDDPTVVSLNNLGQALVAATVFDDGSTDNCGIVNYEVRRMISDCSPATTFGSHVNFECCDIGDTIMVEIRVTDAAGNSNSCMVEVKVQDKQAPILICPTNKTIECGADTSAMVLGEATALDNCDDATVSHFDIGDLDPICGTGTITRVWTATDEQGLSASCLQIISVVNSNPFSGNDDPIDPDTIIFPLDIMGVNAIACAELQQDPSLLDPSNTGEPDVIGDVSGCSQVGREIVSELIFEVGDIGCGSKKIFRKWAVVDWCQAPINADLTQNGVGVWVHTQIIMIRDSEEPVLTNEIGNINLTADANCEAEVTLPASPGDLEDCSDNIYVTLTHNLTASGVGIGPFTVGPGTYQATYNIDDGCGNDFDHVIDIIVEDNGAPSFKCVDPFSIPLMFVFPASGTLTLNAVDLVEPTAIGACTNNSPFTYTVVHDSLNTNTAPTSTSITFDCDDLGMNSLVIWGCDSNGDCHTCTIEIEIQKTGITCGFDNQPDIAGIIDDEQGQGIDEVEVEINNGQFMEMTDATGYFNIPNLPNNQSFKINPKKNTDARNGVSTYDIVLLRKHILGIELLDSPYKIIAGDVNGSGGLTALDLVQIRNLILMNVDEFPNGMPSWRFIDADFVFSNPSNPFADDFPEEVNVQNLTSDLMDLDFVAVKLGDISGNATSNLLVNSDTRDKMGDLIFKTNSKEVEKGELVSLVFETEHEIDWAAWQFTLSYETEFLDFLEIKKLENVHFGKSKVEEGAITCSWTKDVDVLLKDKLMWFDVQWVAKENVLLEDAIKITSRYTPAIAYDASGGEYDIQLDFSSQDGMVENQEFRLYQNQPNPFSESTEICYYLPKADEVELTVYDLTGKILKTYTAFSDKGKHSLTIRNEEIFSRGILYYQLKTSEYQASRKMILLP